MSPRCDRTLQREPGQRLFAFGPVAQVQVALRYRDAGMAEQLGHQQHVAAGAVVGEGGEPTPQAVAGERCGLLDTGTDVIPQAWPSKRPGKIQSPPRRRIARES